MTVVASAVVLAGGLGSRMGSLSLNRPKHILEVAGEPFIVHQFRWLASHGVVDVVLATSYLADQFEPVLGDGSRWGVRLRYSAEPTPKGTAGGLLMATQEFEAMPDRLVVVNGDLLTRHDLSRQLALSLASPTAAAVLHLRTVGDARAYGSVVADHTGRVSAFVEKSEHPPSSEVNAGTYVLRRSVLEGIPDGIASLEVDVFPALAAKGQVVAYREQALWQDVGTPAALVRASKALVEQSGQLTYIDATAIVAPDARITDGSAVGRGVRIQAGARVIGSVIMAGATVGAGACVSASVLGPGVTLPNGVTLSAGVIA